MTYGWLIEGAVLAALGLIGAAIGRMFIRLRQVEARNAADNQRIASLEKNLGQIPQLLDAVHKIRLCIAENYVRRDDYVQQVSMVLTKLDALATTVARVDERTKHWEKPPA